jgi:hypothetical protein
VEGIPSEGSDPMNPREQIAQVLREHVPFEHDWGVDGDCICGFVTPKWDEFAAYSDHVADVVVEALGLTEERRTLENGEQILIESRWISGWSVVGGEPSE